MSEHPNAALCHRFLDAVEQGDMAVVAEIYAPDAVIWHNTDEKETSREENLQVLRDMVRSLSERRYVDRRVTAHEGGFIDQHVLTARLESGAPFRLPACLICTVENGRITRLDEYFDQAALRRQFAPRPR